MMIQIFAMSAQMAITLINSIDVFLALQIAQNAHQKVAMIVTQNFIY